MGCTAGSLLKLRPGDQVLDFGGGCGLGAIWLTASFDAIFTNSALQGSRPFAVQCEVLCSHFVRLLRVGGILWWGDLGSPFSDFESSQRGWENCLSPLTDAKQISLHFVPELAMGATESWTERAFSLVLVK